MMVSAILAVLTVAAPAAVTETEVRAVEEKAKHLSVQLVNIRQENRMLESRCEALMTTAELISGERTTPPKRLLEETEVLRPFGTGRTLDNRSSGKQLVAKEWLNLSHPGRYRAKARLALKDAKGLKNFKFGCMISGSGIKTRWPAAPIGRVPFPEREVSFDFDVPQDSNVLLLIGFESGTGLAEFRDVRICELKEVMR